MTPAKRREARELALVNAARAVWQSGMPCGVRGKVLVPIFQLEKLSSAPEALERLAEGE